MSKKKKKKNGENKMNQGLNTRRPLGLIIIFKKAQQTDKCDTYTYQTIILLQLSHFMSFF